MNTPLRVLILEDRPAEAELMLHELRRGGFEPDWQRVETEADYLATLDPALDLILADYNLPQFDGLRALAMLQERGLDIPFIIVSGVIGEDLAVSAMKQGAADYLLKDRLARLGPAAAQALEQERLRDEKRWAETQLTYQANLLENLGDAVISTDLEFKVTSWNPAAETMYGWSAREVIGQPLNQLVSPEYFEITIEELIKDFLDKGYWRGETSHKRKDGTRMHILASVSLVKDSRGKPVSAVAVNRDITERKQAEAMLQRMEMKYRTLAENSPDLITRFDRDLRHTYVNPAAARAGRLSASEYIGKTILETGVPEAVAEIWERRIRQAIETKQIVEVVDAFATPAGNQFFQTQLVPELAPDGTVQSVLSIAHEITERKRAETALQEHSARLEEMVEERTRALQEAQEKLVRREKLAVLGQLAGGVGHELRNPLAAIRNAIYILNTGLESLDPEIQESLEIIERQIGISESIIGSLLDFARTRSPVCFEINLNKLIRQALACIEAPSKIEVVQQFDPALPAILADRTQLDQVFGNLILNAIQAMPEGGLLTLRTELGEQPIAETSQNREVVVSISDTGKGIPTENLAKLFEPLFTTKSNGIGLGLALVKTLVEGHGGTIGVKSQEGEGSTFTVRLPLEVSEDTR
jgi:PAS domain S-box-containing protein